MSAIAFNGEIYPSGARMASDQIYDNSNTGLPANVQGAIDKTTGNITALDTVELTATATHAHAVGSTFLWIGQLVKVTTAIAVGDTIAVGTNVANTDISSILSELNSKSVIYISSLISIEVSADSHAIGGYFGRRDLSSIVELTGKRIVSAFASNHYGYPIPLSFNGTTFSVCSNTSSNASLYVLYSEAGQ